MQRPLDGFDDPLFSVADLTAASLLSLVVFPPELHARPPEPKARVLTDWLARWAGHPGTAWVVDISRRHRSPSAVIAASGQGAKGLRPVTPRSVR